MSSFQPTKAVVDIENPFNGQKLGSISAAQPVDIDNAVSSTSKTPSMARNWGPSPPLNPLTSITPSRQPRLAELVMEAAFPPGVINILCGIGSVAGQALADHREVRKISFTGITVVGRQLLATSSKTNLKKVSLELGGKGPSIVFADADWEHALSWTTAGITVNNGQICAAGSLASAVFTENVNRAIRVGESLESGQVTANMWGTVNVNTPFGGVKETGFGRNLGRDALDEWTHVKCIKFQVSNL
ncbi:hypothetical protein CEP51_013013 [Fusarium floridanum]|uniref:aldehyde dehydrogenase (NAD(+)) n=1 Tax=Fusarium floridanum TaxID=1325733 RepID=A0A428QJA8_9HYPO|nr:hypothetical protein CEP51_013013 [Fusarium floridanum]